MAIGDEAGADSSYTIDYSQSNGQTTHTLVYAFNVAEGRGGWLADSYTPSAVVHYGEEGDNQQALLVGGDDGAVYQFTGVDDNSTAIGCHVRTYADDQGDARLQKLYGDAWFDADTKNADIKVKLGYDNYTTVSTGRILTTDPRDVYPIDPDSQAWVNAKNVCADLIWRADRAGMALYTWEPRWHEQAAPLAAKSWVLPATDFGLDNFLYTGYIYLPHVSTTDLSLIFTIDGTAQAPITITHGAGVVKKTFQRLPVMKGKLFKIRLASAEDFRVLGPEAELLMKQWGQPSAWLRLPMFTDMATSELAQ